MGKTIANSSIELRAHDAAVLTRLVGAQLNATDSDAEVLGKIGDALKAMARRDWAVRVLDAYLRGQDIGTGPTPDVARLAAAEAVWPELPESVRAEIGERP